MSQLSCSLWLGHKLLILVLHCAPDMEIKWIEIWRVWWPLRFFDEVRSVLPEPLLRMVRRVNRCTILLKDKAIGHQAFAILDQLWEQAVNVVLSVYLRLLSNKVQSSYAGKTDPSRHHDVSRELGSLHKQTLSINVALSFSRPNSVILSVHWRIDVENFLISEKQSFDLDYSQTTQQSLATRQSLQLGIFC